MAHPDFPPGTIFEWGGMWGVVWDDEAAKEAWRDDKYDLSEAPGRVWATYAATQEDAEAGIWMGTWDKPTHGDPSTMTIRVTLEERWNSVVYRREQGYIQCAQCDGWAVDDYLCSECRAPSSRRREVP